MNRSVAISSAFAAALLVGLIGLRRAAPDSAPDPAAVASAPAAPSAATPSAVAAAGPRSGESRSSDQPFASAASPTPGASDAAPASLSTPLGISAEHLAEARRQAAELAGNIDGFRATLEDARYHNQSLNSGQPAKKLALRLGLDAEAGAAVEAVFAAALSEQIERRISAERERLDREARLLAEDRDGYVSYLALETMLARGAALSPEQSAFHRTFGAALSPSDAGSGASPASAAGVASAETAAWYEDPALLAELGARLSPEQNAALAVYVEEQKGRDQETRTLHARMRANRIAEQLGLSAADQNVLLDYLQESPGATSGEIAALLPAELRELLPAGM